MPLEWKFFVHSWTFEVHSNNSDCILSAFQIFGPIYLVLGGGGHAPKCTDKNKKWCRLYKLCNVYVRATERAKRVSASEIYVFSDLKINLYTNTINAVVWHFKWQHDWQNSNIERIIWICERGLENVHIKNCYFFNISLVLQKLRR